MNQQQHAVRLGIGNTLRRDDRRGIAAQFSASRLYSLLSDFSGQLVGAVGIGVGIAVLLGILRFFYGWSLKILIIPTVCILLALTIFAHTDPVLQPILGLVWDCGAVTTGPVTVPLVLALGIGVCRIVGDGEPATLALAS